MIISAAMDTLQIRKTSTLLKPGTRIKVEVHVTEPPVVLHTFVRHCDNRIIELDAPSVQGKRMGVLPETRVTLKETSTSGLLLADTEVLEVRTKPLPVWVLRVPGLEDIRHIQRRREERYEADLHLRWKMRDETGWPEKPLLLLVNVNTYGAFVAVPADLEVGEEIIIDLTPLIQIGGNPHIKQRITPRCKVVRCAAGPVQRYGVTFENLERLEKRFLAEGIRRLKSQRV